MYRNLWIARSIHPQRVSLTPTHSRLRSNFRINIESQREEAAAEEPGHGLHQVGIHKNLRVDDLRPNISWNHLSVDCTVIPCADVVDVR
jgi:hypothetical protein